MPFAAPKALAEGIAIGSQRAEHVPMRVLEEHRPWGGDGPGLSDEQASATE